MTSAKTSVWRMQHLLFVLFLATATILCRAQTITGSVRGVITDPSGAVIPGATVTAKNVETGVSSSTVTNSTGLYSIQFLQIGRYTIEVKAKGFGEEHSSPFQLEIDQQATINVPMHMEGSSTQVSVNFDTAPILNTENASLGVTIDQTAISNMPLNNRSFVAATVAVPGSIHTGGNTNEQPAVNGNRQQGNSMLLDGMDIYDNINNAGTQAPTPNSQPQGALYVPNSDALQEIRVITSNAPAEFGNVSGGQIVAVTKNGTNQFHGNAFFQLENYQLNANTFANKFTSGTATALTPYTQTFFGGTLGGPIKKDKLFFFVDYQGFRYHQSGTAFTGVAPAAFRTGDLSLLLAPVINGKPHTPIQLFNSQNHDAPFVNNQIPITSPIAQFLFANPAAYPLPNSPATDGIAQNNYLGLSNSFNRNNQGDIKIDWKASSRDNVSGRFTIARTINGTIGTPVPVSFPNAASPTAYTSFVVSEVHTFSTNAVNELRAGFGRNNQISGLPTDPSGLFGTAGNQKVGINMPQNGYEGFAQQVFNPPSGGYDISNIGSYDTPQDFTENTYFYGDNFTLQHGHHLMKMGVQFLRYQQNYSYSGNAGVLGQVQYQGYFTGDPFADFLSNYVTSQTVDGQVGRFGQRQWRDGAFFQDDWKVLPNLTINLGVRYDYSQPIYEVHNQETNVNLATGALEAAGQDGNSRALYNPTYDQLLPRLGFAYSPTARTVIRGGYGISSYFEGLGVGLRLTQNPPYQAEYQSRAVIPTTSDPAGAPLNVEQALSTDLTATGTYNAWSPNVRPSWNQEFSLTVEYQLSNNSSLQMGYVGQTAQHLAIPRMANQLTAPNTPAPFANSLGQNVQVKLTDTEGMMNYNAFQAVFRKRSSNGLDFTANYTYSKAMTNAGQGFNGIYGTNGQYYQQDAYNLRPEYGPSPLDATHNVSGSLVYELPLGRGHRFGKDWSRLTDIALGGWKISGLASAFSGNPLTITSNANYTQIVNSADARANHLRPLHVTHRGVGNWFGTDPSAQPCLANAQGAIIDNGLCAYSEQSATAFGSATPGSERGPGFENIDLSGFKAFHFTDSQSLEFRADAFNAFNFASYNNPDTGVNDANFGQINSTRNNPRTLQLALNYRF
jgi:hypothetical protein